MNKEILNLISNIESKYGKGAVSFLNPKIEEDIPSISTGIYSLNKAIGIGGYPKGRIIEIFGPEGSGKTTIALHAIAQAQKANLIAAYIDVENALDPTYARNIGVNLQNLIISQPNSGEQSLDIVEHLVKNEYVDLVIVDSVAALVPIAELESNMEDQQIGSQARLMSRALRKINHALTNSKTIIIFINQLRQKVGIIFGSPEITSGGKALKYYSSVRIDVRRDKIIRDVDKIIGNHIKLKIVKNKVGIPFNTINLQINYGEGVDLLDDLINLAIQNNILVKKGSWFAFENNNLVQGKERLKKWLLNEKNILEAIKLKLFHDK